MCISLHIPRSRTAFRNFKELMEASKRDLPEPPAATGMTISVAASAALQAKPRHYIDRANVGWKSRSIRAAKKLK